MRKAHILPSILWLLLSPVSNAYEINDQLVVQIGMHGILQHGEYSNAADEDGSDLDNKTRIAAMFDLVVDYTPTARDEFYLWVRYARGNLLNNVRGNAPAPYGGELEDDVTDINERGRDYLMEAWYKHAFEFESSSLGLTAGLVDSTNYIDGNEYANNEETQFMNEAFVYSTNPALPSFDIGSVAEFEGGDWSVRGLYMNTRFENDAYNYFAAQIGYHPETRLGPGNYRIFAFTTDNNFTNASGRDERLQGVGLSFDQELNDIFGVFIRTGWINDNVDPPYDLIVTGGTNIRGKPWGRPQDNIGFALGYLSGADTADARSIQVAEGYVRFVLTDNADLSFDVQYEKDKLRGSGEDPSAIILGTRLNVVF